MATNSFDYPADAPISDQTGRIAVSWGQWFSRVHALVASLYQSGVTADRPTKVLWVGRRYFDTTLGKPVWIRSVKPAVWVDGAGTVV